MLLLFLVSGICSRYYLDSHTAKEFAKSRTRKLLIPSTVGLFAFQFIQGYVSMSISDAFDSMQEVPAVIKYFIMALSGTGVLWYIQLLWLFSMVLLLIRKIDKDRLWKLGGKANIIAILLMAIVIWGAAQILNTPVVVVYRFGYYGAAFLLGYFVFSHDEVIAALKKHFVLLFVLGVGVGTAFCIMYFGDNYAEAPIKDLRGFAKLNLKPGETAKAEIVLDGESFQYYDPSIDELSTRPGRYQILYGTSSLEKDLKSIDFVVK